MKYLKKFFENKKYREFDTEEELRTYISQVVESSCSEYDLKWSVKKMYINKKNKIFHLHGYEVPYSHNDYLSYMIWIKLPHDENAIEVVSSTVDFQERPVFDRFMDICHDLEALSDRLPEYDVRFNIRLDFIQVLVITDIKDYDENDHILSVLYSDAMENIRRGSSGWTLRPSQFLTNRMSQNNHAPIENWTKAKEDGFVGDNYFIIQLNNIEFDKRGGSLGKTVFKNRYNNIFEFVEMIKSSNKYDFLKCDLSKIRVEKIEPDKIKVSYLS